MFLLFVRLTARKISTSGVRFDSQPVRISVPASSFHMVALAGIPMETGNLVIRGCVVQAPGGVSREFVLPLSTEEEEERLSRKREAMECERGRSKYSGLDCFPWSKLNKRASTRLTANSGKATTFQFLQCTVVPEQPLLQIRRTSVTHGAVMLYDGEMSVHFQSFSILRDLNCRYSQVCHPSDAGECLSPACRFSKARL